MWKTRSPIREMAKMEISKVLALCFIYRRIQQLTKKESKVLQEDNGLSYMDCAMRIERGRRFLLRRMEETTFEVDGANLQKTWAPGF